MNMSLLSSLVVVIFIIVPPLIAPSKISALSLTLRIQNFNNLSSTIDSDNISTGPVVFQKPSSGYLHTVLVGVGTPKRWLPLVLDTASSLVWFQCHPCDNCHPQQLNNPEPYSVFDPTKSTTFQFLDCKSELCECNNESKCGFREEYTDGAVAVGELATETLTFDDGNTLTNEAVGCAHYADETKKFGAGILGLARGNSSITSQISRKFGLNVFSYCLAMRRSAVTHLIFSDRTLYSGVVYTPMLQNPVHNRHDLLYYVGLTGISIGGTRIAEIDAKMFQIKEDGSGGVFIDTGYSDTKLVTPAYDAFEATFRDMAEELDWPLYNQPDTLDSSLCYDFDGYPGTGDIPMHDVVFHFQDGAGLILGFHNCMTPVSLPSKPFIYCFAFKESNDDSSSIGAIQQRGTRMVYDLANSRIGFRHDNCID